MLSFTAQLSAQQTQAAPAASGTSASPVPRLVKFSGVLVDHQDQPLKGPVGVTFSLYAQQSGDSPLWMETQNVELDGKGAYTVLLGANTATGLPRNYSAQGRHAGSASSQSASRNSPRAAGQCALCLEGCGCGYPWWVARIGLRAGRTADQRWCLGNSERSAGLSLMETASTI
jgi:hypothetical protein